MKTPYPGRFESFDHWNQRCDEAEARQRAENEERYNSAPNGRGLTVKQKAKLTKAQAKLPSGWFFWVTNDNTQLGLSSKSGELALVTKHGNMLDAGVWGKGDRGAILALFLNRACAAVWGVQPQWYGTFKPEDWSAARVKLVRLGKLKLVKVVA